MLTRQFCRRLQSLSIASSVSQTASCRRQIFSSDNYTNVPKKILDKVGVNQHLRARHPINTVKNLLESSFLMPFPQPRRFAIKDSISPIVTPKQNFDDLLVPADHISRSASDTYYINQEWLLRTHTSAHQVQFLRDHPDGFLVTADVYRRDEIDTSHYPVFHQTEGVCTFTVDDGAEKFIRYDLERLRKVIGSESTDLDYPPTSIQAIHGNSIEAHLLPLVIKHLQLSLECLVKNLFGDEQLQTRWVEGNFPFTSPSWELEIMYRQTWMEVLGCGIIRNEILQNAGHSNRIGWAFGMGLERIAMALFGIPDIRLFWSEDPRFMSQFEPNTVRKFVPFSKYPATYRDISFWVPNNTELTVNDFCEKVRDIAGDLVENVTLVDQFKHPVTGLRSNCFRITYRSMSKTLVSSEIDEIQDELAKSIVDSFGVTLR